MTFRVYVTKITILLVNKKKIFLSILFLNKIRIIEEKVSFPPFGSKSHHTFEKKKTSPILKGKENKRLWERPVSR